jgi:hypothetical protein
VRRFFVSGGIAIALALAMTIAHAATTITIEWVPTAGATSYDIEQSTDTGTTWAVAKSVKSSAACTATKCSTTYAPPASGLVLFRMVTWNAQGKTTRTHAGFWYNAIWSLPDTASSAEIR